MTRRVLVTGASSGIGAATARALAAAGLQVLGTARRADRLEKLAKETGIDWVAADLSTDEGIETLVNYAAKGDPITAVVNNAGGALGTDPVAEGDVAEWRRMYEINVISTLRVTQAFLPYIREHGGDLVFISSTAGHNTYPGGAGYVAAKHAERQIPNALRLELVGEPVRVIDISPGMVHTEEFSLVRYHGDQAAADQVYAGVDHPLVAEDIAEAVRWALMLPEHVNIDSMVIRPRAQASNTLVARN